MSGSKKIKHLIGYKMIKICLILSTLCNLNSCSLLNKIRHLEEPPAFSTLNIPTANFPSNNENLALKHSKNIRKTNSLWQKDSTTFFRDSKAWKIGDIIKVIISIKDSARLDNTTGHSRASNEKVGLPIPIIQPNGNLNGISFPTLEGKTNKLYKGSGNVSRKEDVSTQIAATVKEVLPNGNLLVQGHQEIRVNQELREVKIMGIIRPQDITADNTINSDQIAEARISYGGRGDISEVQKQRYGSKILDALLPF